MHTRSTSHHQQQRPQSSTSSRQILSPPPTKTHFSTPATTPSSSRRGSHQRKHQELGIGIDHMAESSQIPVSPTPKNGGQRGRRGHPTRRTKGKRNDGELADGQADGAEQGEEEQGGDEDMLFDLLGVTSPPAQGTPSVESALPNITASTRGILNISRADIEQGKKNRPQKKKEQVESSPEIPEHSVKANNVKSRATQGERDVQSEGEVKRRNQRRKGKGKADQSPTDIAPTTANNQPTSALTASRPPKPSKQPQPITYTPIKPPPEYNNDAFETESLSRSLPSGKLFGPPSPPQQSNNKVKGKAKKAQGDESAVWEMPSLERPSTTQALTWQQQLQSSSSSNDSPRKSNKFTPQSGPTNNSERKPRSRPATSAVPLNQVPAGMTSSPLVPRPGHARRFSLDNNLPISTFDHNQPFHTGMNVNRPPQTPAKLPGNMAPGAVLPILQGEFPRIGKPSNSTSNIPTSAAPMGASTPAGIKYAGPTFHNSPHAASLPKPDLDDF